MKTKGAIKLLAFCLLSIILAVGIRSYYEWNNKRFPVEHERMLLGVPVVQEDWLPAGREKLSSAINPGICYEGVLLPYDASGICYLPQNLGEEWLGELSAVGEEEESYFLCMPEDTYLDHKDDAIRENHSFVLWMVGDTKYYQVELVITGMPMLVMDTERQEEPEDFDYYEDPDRWTFDRDFMNYGTIGVFNPGVGTGQYEIVQSRVTYHDKGGITRGFHKRSYSLSLKNGQEENVDVSLLGMRSDNSWKLNSLVTDPNKIREKTASQIWEQFDLADTSIHEAGPREEYVEVVIDNEYRGIYCLVEPVDDKKLALDRNDVLYKTYGEKPTTDEDYGQVIEAGWKMTDTVRLRYPQEYIDFEQAWYPMRDYTNTFMWSSKADATALEQKIHLGNICDNLMYLYVCAGSDNQYKNNYYVAKVDAPGDYTMYRIPWDMDLTFGNVFDLESNTKSYFETDYTVGYTMEEWDAIYASQPEQIRTELHERWSRYRKSFLSTESINGLLVANRDYLVESGAVAREQVRWPEAPMSMDIAYLLEYQTKRMEWLDQFFAEGAVTNE